MFELNLPVYDVKIKKVGSIVYIWDRVRKKYLVMTPEEWVRQHFVNYLITEKKYPESLIANEIQINLNRQKKRCDSVIYDNQLTPIMILEYKSPNVEISQLVFDQIVRYNMVLKVKYLIVSNGINHYCCQIDYEKQGVKYLEEIPDYTSL